MTEVASRADERAPIDTRPVADALRDLLNWVAVFETEYDLPDEVEEELRGHVERIADALESVPGSDLEKRELFEEYESLRAERELEYRDELLAAGGEFVEHELG